MNNSALPTFFNQLLESELQHLCQKPIHHITTYTSIIITLKNKVSTLFANRLETNKYFVEFIESKLLSLPIEIERHPESIFLEMLRVEDNHVQYFTELCVRLLDLLYLCYVGYNIRQNNKWSIQLDFLIKQCKILMMFECHDSLDTLLVDFLEQITKNKLQSQPTENKMPPPLLTSRFLQKLHKICQKYQLSYLDDWVIKHKQLMKMHWEEKHRKTVHQRKQKKNQTALRRRTVVIVPPNNRQNKEIKKDFIDKRDRKSVKPNQRYREENKFCSARKQNFNQRLSIYKDEKQRRKSQNCRRRTIHQEKFKYTTKNYNQQIIYTFIDQDQPLNTNTQTLLKQPTTSQQQQPEHPIKQHNPIKFQNKNK